MTELDELKLDAAVEKLCRDIDGLRTAIRLASLTTHEMTFKHVREVLERTAACVAELQEFQRRLREIPYRKPSRLIS
jgi:hypothetical protein